MARRYMCTYHSPGFLLPPHDLIQLASCAQKWNQASATVVDAIAHKYSEAQVSDIIAQGNFNMVVALTGVDTFGEDMACLDRLKENQPNATFVIFGYYPTTFPEETLRNSKMDAILCCEPEEPLSHYLDALEKGADAVEGVVGLAGRRADGSIFVNPSVRVSDMDALPLPDYALVDVNRYEEAFLGKPCGAILSSRGCPFSCSYCTTTYGRRLTAKSPERVIEEIQCLEKTGIRFIRFLDDTFTINRTRVIEICKQMTSLQNPIPWSCLSRVDTLDQEMLEWMAKAGCKRILVGIESYSERMLRFLNKQIEPSLINKQIALIKNSGIEAFGFFLIGGPIETDEDFEQTLRGALKAPLDFLTLNIMTPYAGTPFFNQIREQIDFNLTPFRCDYKDPNLAQIATQRKRRLYLRFYLRPSVLYKHVRWILRHPLFLFRILVALTR